MPDTVHTTTPTENTDDPVVDAVTSGLRSGIHTIHVTNEDKRMTTFPPKVTTEADAIPGEDDLRSRWVTVAAVDDID